MLGRAIFVTLCALGATALGFTTYTLPIQGAGTDPDLPSLIARALHDSEPTLPLASAYLPVTAESGTALQLRGVETRFQGEGPAEQVTEWVRRAALADSAALRAWLGVWVRAVVSTNHDTIHLALYRVTLHRGCPLLSTLHATRLRSDRLADRMIRIESTCPALANPTPNQ